MSTLVSLIGLFFYSVVLLQMFIDRKAIKAHISTPRIENWRIAFGDQIVGQVYGDPRFEDGDIIVTSSVVRWDHTTGKVYTKNSGYELGKRGND